MRGTHGTRRVCKKRNDLSLLVVLTATKLQVRITATCIRVPVMRAHAESINLEFERDITEQEAVDALAAFPGVSIINDRAANR